MESTWKQLAEERIRRSDLASDDSQAFRKSWQDGETARRQAAMKHVGQMSHMYYNVLHGSHDMNQNHMKSHEVGCVFLDVTADHSSQCGGIYLAVWLLQHLAANVVSCSVSCSVSLRFLEILEPRCEYRTASTAACPCRGKVLTF